MSWKHDFSTAVQHFRKGELEFALEGFNQAIEKGGKTEYIIFDSRSAVFEKLGRRKDALKDARTTIQIAPEQWQGYARAARLFHQTQKFESAMKMVEVALKKLKEGDTKRRKDLLTLKDDIAFAQDEYIRRTTNHWGQLPIELFAEIALMLVEEESPRLFPLSQVCKDWRRVIWDSPHFWSTLVLGRSRPHIKAKRWVERSKGKIHTLKVQAVACDRASWNGEGLKGILWDQLRVCKIENWDICKFLQLSGSIASLSSLSHYAYDNEDRHNIVQYPYHASWPIQHLSLTSIALPSYFADIAEKNLLGLTFRKIIGKVKLVLESHKSLQMLTLDTVDATLEELPDALPDLQHLEIRRLTRQTSPILDLAMPQLNTLHLESSPFALGSALDSLLSKSSGRLTTLVLKSMPLSEPQKLIEFLRSNPALMTLDLSRMHPGVDLIVEALATPVPDSTSSGSTETLSPLPDRMCPQLTHLDVSYCHDIRTGPLVRLLRSRNSEPPSDGCPKISTLIVDGCDKLEAERLPWFRSQVERFSYVNNWSSKLGRRR